MYTLIVVPFRQTIDIVICIDGIIIVVNETKRLNAAEKLGETKGAGICGSGLARRRGERGERGECGD